MSKDSLNIENSEVVESVFGYWPSFHDAEVHGIVLSREDESGAQLVLKIHHWHMTDKVDDNGFFVLKNHTFTELLFSGIADLELYDFHQPSIIANLEILETPDMDRRFSVEMRVSYGCGAKFRCNEIKVVTSAPYEEIKN